MQRFLSLYLPSETSYGLSHFSDEKVLAPGNYQGKVSKVAKGEFKLEKPELVGLIPLTYEKEFHTAECKVLGTRQAFVWEAE